MAALAIGRGGYREVHEGAAAPGYLPYGSASSDYTRAEGEGPGRESQR